MNRKRTGRKPSAKSLENLKKGHGRPKGVPNKATLEAKEFCASLLTDPVYQANLRKRLRSGRLAPAVETMVWAYSAGKPKETVTLDGDLTFTLKDANDRLAGKLARLAAGRAGDLSPES